MHKSSALLPLLFVLTAASPPESSRWRAEASRVTITRDDWGIAHVHGQTDADAVFGMIYAQAEDDFPRIEANYLTNLGRTAEADGEKAIWQDLRARLYVSDAKLKDEYAKSPEPMRKLMDAWADGLNYFLATHPDVHPRAIKRFEPWMVLSFTEGSIGGDIERIDLDALQDFYSPASPSAGERADRSPSPEERDAKELQGSNGIAIAPSLTSGGHALLLINPHTSHYFRSEQQVTSDEGLNVYGAATWGQFFIYQGFNAHAGWMHTSSGVDNVDEFSEVVEQKGKGRCYRYGATCRPLGVRLVTIRYKLPNGRMTTRTVTTYYTHRGPIVRAANGRWIAFAMMDRPIEALQQSFNRTKATDLASFMEVAQLKANSSNDTVFADDKGAIAYLHPQFVPSRDDRFDFTKPVDGSNPVTDWGNLHRLSSLPNSISPPNGWVQNTNTWPYRAAGAYSPDPRYFPKYMDTVGENFRGIHVQKLLTGSRGWTIERLQGAAFDSFQPGFAELVPALVRAYDFLPTNDPRRGRLEAPVALLRSWDYRWSADSVAQTVATLSGNALIVALNPPADQDSNVYMARLAHDTTDAQKVAALDEAVGQLQRDFGRWQVPWGEMNRFQRISSSISPRFSDDAPSIPVPFAQGKYGSLASFEMHVPKTTKRFYGTYGNSFVAVVEFGPRVRAHAITAGGESGDPKSPHFDDQAQRYASGNLRDVYFYPDQLNGHTERVYHPGE
ncbi:penicillin acylase family protein [Sphingomonas sp. URHD0057]|uniref:penicillin acylase family protein n=1 Tax=Sphingomonas sp. URHD0057 TaxID=1380389 RepID=UPI00049197D8|nr:penicillin acylase family protein [Sphingomonas sp. URHD0057]